MKHLAVTSHIKNIDLDNYVITDVIMATPGVAQGWGFAVDEEFLIQFVSLTDSLFGSEGLPAECDHNHGQMGKQLGVFKSIKWDGQHMRGDLHMYRSADNSPTHPKLASWVMSQAAEDPRSINSSIKFEDGGFYQKDSEGQKIDIWYDHPDHGWMPKRKDLGQVFIKLSKPKGCDLVTKGALTERLFSQTTMKEQLNDMIQHPYFFQMLEMSRDEFPTLQEFYHQQNNNNLLTKFKNLIMGNKTETPATPHTTATAENTVELSEDQKVIQALKEQNEALETRLSKLETPATPHTTATSENTVELSEDQKVIQALKEQNEALETRLSKLESQDSAPETSAPVDTTTVDLSKKSYMNFDIQSHAKKILG